VGFTIASLLCAIAPNIALLIVFRVLQGFLGAMLLPQGFGLIRDVFPPKEFGKAFAAYGPVFGLGGILGPILGGFLIEANIADLAWRSVFLVNVPIGMAAVILSFKYLPKSVADKTVKIDFLGAFMVVIASGMLVYPLMTGEQNGWPWWSFAMLAGSIVLFVLFALLEKATVKRGSPLIDAEIFKKRAYTVGLGGIALYFACSTGIYLILSLFLQFGESFSASEAGLGNIPIAVGAALGGGISGGFLAEKIGSRVLQIGAILQIVGAVLLIVATPTSSDFNIWQLVPGLVIAGIGTGFVVSALFDIILSSVEGRLAGSASGVLSAVQSVFASAGVAVFGSVFFASALAGDAAAGFRNALYLQLALLVVFLVLSPLMPKKAAHE
jgi:EmrB/QacA subfamily drug resistance transporter